MKTKDKRRTKQLRPGMVLLGMYVVGVVIRYLLTLGISTGPTVRIDEMLYVNLARGLFYEGEVLYRAQPTEYVYLLYPIVLLPLFLLPVGANLYRCIQLWNVLLMTSMVFPSYLIGKKLGLQKKHALIIAGFSLILPETFLSVHLVCESLVYPCVLWMILLALHAAKKPENCWIPAALGAASGLSYFIKANCIVFGASFLLVSLIYGIVKKQRKRWLGGIFGLSTLLIFTGGGYLLYEILFKDVSLLTFYEKQIPNLDVKTVLTIIQATIFNLLAIIYALGPALCLLPLIAVNKLREENRIFFLALIVAVVAMAVSIGVMIVPYGYKNDNTGTWYNCSTHTRYLAYLLLPILAGLFLPELHKIRLSKNRVVWLWACAGLLLFPTPFNMFTSNQLGTFDSPSLNAFDARYIGYIAGALVLIGLVICNAAYIKKLDERGWTTEIRNAICGVTALFMMANNVMLFKNYEPVLVETDAESQAIVEKVADEEYLLVTTNMYNDLWGAQLDVHIRRPQLMVTMNDLIMNAEKTGGIYSSFVPGLQSPNTSNKATPECVNMLLFNIACADYVEFCPEVVVETSASGLYTIAHIPTDRPYLKTAIANMEGNRLWPADKGQILVFNQDMLAKETFTLIVSLCASEEETGEVRFSFGGGSVTLPVTAEMTTHSIKVSVSPNQYYQCAIQTTVPMTIEGYKTE